jgi:hypothetical protein
LHSIISHAIPSKTRIRVLRYRGELARRDIVPRVEMICAVQLGVSAAVVSDPTRAMNSPSALFLLHVQDTLTALHNLTTHYHRLIPNTPPHVAVIGPRGKRPQANLPPWCLRNGSMWSNTWEQQQAPLGTIVSIVPNGRGEMSEVVARTDSSETRDHLVEGRFVG